MDPNPPNQQDDVPSLAGFFCKGAVLRQVERDITPETVSYLPYPLPDDLYVRLRKSCKITPAVLRAFASSQTKVSLVEVARQVTDEYLDALLEFDSIRYDPGSDFVRSEAFAKIVKERFADLSQPFRADSHIQS
jgi:hypothetical protein